MNLLRCLRCILLLAATAVLGEAFQPGLRNSLALALRAGEEWAGEVVKDGRIKGCTITPVSETEFTIQIDGIEADLGNFGAVVYRKITADAKKQRFQGFRPGTIPPHLVPAYKTFAMDEVAREAVLEAMQQNNIRPFDSARAEMLIEQVAIPPKQKSKKKKGSADSNDTSTTWQTYETMKDALKAGWEVSATVNIRLSFCIHLSFKSLVIPIRSQDRASASLPINARAKRSNR